MRLLTWRISGSLPPCNVASLLALVFHLRARMRARLCSCTHATCCEHVRGRHLSLGRAEQCRALPAHLEKVLGPRSTCPPDARSQISPARSYSLPLRWCRCTQAHVCSLAGGMGGKRARSGAAALLACIPLAPTRCGGTRPPAPLELDWALHWALHKAGSHSDGLQGGLAGTGMCDSKLRARCHPCSPVFTPIRTRSPASTTWPWPAALGEPVRSPVVTTLPDGCCSSFCGQGSRDRRSCTCGKRRQQGGHA